MDIILEIIQLLIAIPAGILFCLCSLGNWSLIIGFLLGKVKTASLVLPFLGPIFGVLFFLVLPIQGLAAYWWLAILIEPSWLLGAWCLATWPFINRKQPSDS